MSDIFVLGLGLKLLVLLFTVRHGEEPGWPGVEFSEDDEEQDWPCIESREDDDKPDRLLDESSDHDEL